MRIVHINTTFSSGGAAMVAKCLHDEQNRHGLHAAFVSRETLGIPKYVNVAAFRATSREGLFSNWRRFFRSADFTQADVIHLHNAHGYYMPRWALLRILGKPCVWTLHDYWLLTGRCAMPESCNGFESGCSPCPHKDKYPATWIDRAGRDFADRRQLLEFSAVFVAPTEFVRRKFLSQCDSEIWTIQNPIEAETSAPTRIEARRRLGLPNDKTIVVFAARKLEDPRKGLNTFLRALRLCKNQNSLYPVFVGERQTMRLPGPGLVDRQEMASYLAAADAVVVPSTMETFGLIFIEAAIAGAAVLASDIPIAREVLGESGTFFDVGDYHKLAGLLEDESLWSSEHSKASLIEKHHPRRVSAMYLAAYDRAIASNAGSI